MGFAPALMAIGAIGSIAGGFMQADAARQQARSQQQAYEAQAAQQNYQAQVAENNKVIAEQNARVSAAAGEQQALNKSMETRAKVGGMIAAQAASGVDVNSGSALDVQTSEKQIGALDALTIRSNAAREAYGFMQQGQNFQAEADLNRMGAASNIQAGKNAKQAGSMAATASILGGFTSAATKLGGGFSSGAFGGGGSQSYKFGTAIF